MKNWRDLLCEVFQIAEVVAEEAIPLDDFVGGYDLRGDGFERQRLKEFVVISVATHELLIGAISAVQEFENEGVEDAEHF